MSTRWSLSRRGLLATAAASLGGCLSAGPGDDETPGGADQLDLREANVVDVAAESAGRTAEFGVTLHHDDDGEEGYANWWQVESLDGERLGRRELRHPHGTKPFTRSAEIAVPDSVGCVVVRGHDQSHGYGGRAAVYSLETGAATFVDQGTDPETLGERRCR